MNYLKYFILVSVLFCCENIYGQEYEVELDVTIVAINNDVTCNSYFKITLETERGNTIEWLEQLEMSKDGSKKFKRRFICSAGNLINSIRCYSVRNYQNGFPFFDCKEADKGETQVLISNEDYVCRSPTLIYNKFVGYAGSSTISYSIRPLSGSYVIQGDISLEGIIGYNIMFYQVSLEYSDGQVQLLPKRFLTQESDFYSQESEVTTEKQISYVKISIGYMAWGVIKEFNYQFSYNALPVQNPFPEISTFSQLDFIGYISKTSINTNPNEGLLPTEHSVMFEVNEEYQHQFNWEYIIADSSTDPGNFKNSDWTELPFSLAGINQQTVFSGRDLFSALGMNPIDYYYKNVYLRAKYLICKSQGIAFTETISLLHIPSAPGIDSIQTIQETCFGDEDSRLIVYFDRPLVEGESISIQINGEILSDMANITDLGPNNSYEIKDRPSGEYVIELLGKYYDQSSYTGGDNQMVFLDILPKVPLTLQVTQSPVHCFSGADGILTLDADGGTGQYTATLWQGSTSLQQVSFTQVVDGQFQNLSANTYTISITDSNDCFLKDNTGVAWYPQVEVTQPHQGTTLSIAEMFEPLAYGYTDGHITVRAQEGTYPYTFYWTDVDGNAQPPEPVQTEGQTMLSSLAHIGEGVYAVRTEDANFSLVTNRTPQNLAGCFDEISMVLEQPPLLEVSLSEHQYISCFDEADGELLATATGGRPLLTGLPYTYTWFTVDSNAPQVYAETDSISTDRYAATYRVRVTDRNGISAWSSDFELTQPEALTLDFNTTPLLCNGDDNGISQALVQGGTTPYSYSWDTEQTTSTIQNLTEGWYSVVVKDDHDCIAFGQTEVFVPNGLEAIETLTEPSCFGYEDGSIQVTTTGGQTPYQFQWNTSAQTESLESIGSGAYTLTITDGNGCFIERNLLLSQPAQIPVDLGEDRVLCLGQTLELDAVATPGLTYAWTHNGNPFAKTARATLSDEGTYILTVTDANACSNSDAITITRNALEIGSSFAIATRVPIGEPVHITNTSFPHPPSTEWIIPTGVKVLEKEQDHLKLVFPTLGAYNLGIITRNGPCEKSFFQPVYVVTRDELADYVIPNEPFIKGLMVYPNPNNGKFNVTVQLREAANFQLTLFNSQGHELLRENIAQQDYANLDMNLSQSVGEGIYLLQLLTPQGQGLFKVVINK